MPFMARVLGMDVMVDGTVQRAGERVRVTARLVDVHSAKLVWSDSYEYPAQQLAEAQELAARDIAAQVGAHLACRNSLRKPLILLLVRDCEGVSSRILSWIAKLLFWRGCAIVKRADQDSAGKEDCDEEDELVGGGSGGGGGGMWSGAGGAVPSCDASNQAEAGYRDTGLSLRQGVCVVLCGWEAGELPVSQEICVWRGEAAGGIDPCT